MRGWILCAAFVPLLGQSPMPDWQVAAGGPMKFEVASVKRDTSGAYRPPSFPFDAGESYANTGGVLSGRFPLQSFITFAYKLTPTEEQRATMFAALPKWFSTEVFEIEAKAPIPNPTKDQMRLMMQALLADRFQMKSHLETRELPVFALTLAKPGKLGPNLHAHSDGPSCDSAPPPGFFPGRCNLLGMLPQPGGGRKGGARDVTMAYVAQALPAWSNLGRPVIDKTGLSGTFDFTIDWTPDIPDNPQEGANGVPLPDSPGFVSALQEQLGLKLASSSAPTQVPIIDHIEQPSGN